jgi:C-terminal processing protease CtpA/Prc
MIRGVMLLALLVLVAPAAALPSPSSDARADNLRAFAKLYGYIRYFHPSDEASEIDWDALAVVGAARVGNARDPADLRGRLLELFSPVAPTLQIFRSGEAPPARPPPALPPGGVAVTWQHVGYGFGTIRSAYTSLRRNRPREVSLAGAAGFGGALMSTDAVPHRGKVVRLTGRVKTDVTGSGNRGQMWLRVDREKDQVGFFYNMDDRPITDPAWKRYQILGEVAADATHVVFGAFLNGQGRIWLDDFKLEVESEPGSGRFTDVPFPNPGFEADGQNASPWATRAAGYTYEIVAGAAAGRGKRALLVKSNTGTLLDTNLFDGGPAPGAVATRDLGAGLACRFPLALPSTAGKGGRPGHTLPRASRGALAALVRSLATANVPALTADDERVRLGAIVGAWNVFQHFYPYFDVVKTDWDAVLGRALARALADRTHADFARTLRWLVVELQDGHATVRDPRQPPSAEIAWQLDWLEDRVVVVAAARDTGSLPGDVVEAIDGKPAGALLAEKEALVSGSPQWRRHWALGSVSDGPPGSKAEVTVRRGDRSVRLTIARVRQPQLPAPAQQKVEKLAGGVYYVDLSRVSRADIAASIQDVAAAPGVVFDMRGYPEDSFEVLQHLLDRDDTSDRWMQVPRIAYPDRERIVGFVHHAWNLKPKAPRIRGRVAFLTGPGAISAAESLMGFVEHYKLGAIVGRATAGTNGNINPFTVPGGFTIYWTGMKVLKHDGSRHHLVGIRPTAPVTPTIAGLRAGRDETLEAALRIVTPR